MSSVEAKGLSSVEARRMLAEYFELDVRRPSRLHSAILSVAVRMAVTFPDFHFVPFLNLWGLENLRPEDSISHLEDSMSHLEESMSNGGRAMSGESLDRPGRPGGREMSLVERMSRAYVYSLLFHPDEHLETDLENVMASFISKIGYSFSQTSVTLLATRVALSESHGNKIQYAFLIAPDGTEFITPIHTLTQYTNSLTHCTSQTPNSTLTHYTYQTPNNTLNHYTNSLPRNNSLTHNNELPHNNGLCPEEIPERLFNCLLRTTTKGTVRIEAAIPSSQPVSEVFPCTAGYVDHIDRRHHHVHIFDNQSRHFVASHHALPSPVGSPSSVASQSSRGNSNSGVEEILSRWPKEGDFVDFVMVIPKGSSFKSAIINKVYAHENEGSEAFGYRRAKVTFVETERKYCSWELLPSEEPIIETGTTQPSYRKGYISAQILQQANEGREESLPTVGTEIRIIAFLKRGKDGQKRPFVAKVEW